jgi:hypothetical protein
LLGEDVGHLRRSRQGASRKQTQRLLHNSMSERFAIKILECISRADHERKASTGMTQGV